MESDDALVETPAGAPADETYVGCFADSLDDRVMFTVTTLDDLTPEVSVPTEPQWVGNGLCLQCQCSRLCIVITGRIRS